MDLASLKIPLITIFRLILLEVLEVPEKLYKPFVPDLLFLLMEAVNVLPQPDKLEGIVLEFQKILFTHSREERMK